MNQQVNQPADSRSASSLRAGEEAQLSFWRYKPGQGYWTRTLSFLGMMTIAAAGAGWLWRELNQVHLYVQAAVAGLVLFGTFGLGWYIFNKPRVVDFLIATESEMKKVNWPTRREVIGSTWLVIAGTIMMALVLFGIDVVFSYFFQFIKVIQVE